MTDPTPRAPSLPDTLAAKLDEMHADIRASRADSRAARRLARKNGESIALLRGEFDHSQREQKAINGGLREFLTRQRISLHEVKTRTDWAVAVLRHRGPAAAAGAVGGVGILVLFRLLGVP